MAGQTHDRPDVRLLQDAGGVAGVKLVEEKPLAFVFSL